MLKSVQKVGLLTHTVSHPTLLHRITLLAVGSARDPHKQSSNPAMSTTLRFRLSRQPNVSSLTISESEVDGLGTSLVSEWVTAWVFCSMESLSGFSYSCLTEVVNSCHTTESKKFTHLSEIVHWRGSWNCSINCITLQHVHYSFDHATSGWCFSVHLRLSGI